MMQNYQDAMAICRQYGNPDLFVTFTCNPKWPEITRALSAIPGQKPEDRPDIIARVFKMKLNEIYRQLNLELYLEQLSQIYMLSNFKKGDYHIVISYFGYILMKKSTNHHK